MDESGESSSSMICDKHGAGSIATATATTATKEDIRDRIHACEIEITFPTNLQAEQALQILQVDKEPTERASKSFHLVKTKEDEEGKEICKMKVRFESKELKMLRVAVSSFYDYLTIVLKTFQEFDTTI